MQRPLFEKSELFIIGRTLGALLVLFGGIALNVQMVLAPRLPNADGFLPTTATVLDLEQIGSFQDPAFLVTLAYNVPETNTDQVRSGQRVEFEQYFELSVGQEVSIHYDPQNPTDWRIENNPDAFGEFGLGFLMMIFGLLSLAFPAIIRWASRQEDFELKDEFDDIEVSGANVN